MKPGTLPHAVSVSQALAKGVCPICGILKDFQWTVAEKIEPRPALHLCNFHAWALARSAPAENVTTVFIDMLQDPLAHKAEASECILCHRILEEEAARLRELAGQLERAMFVQWLKRHGSLCLEHARKLKEYVPLKHQRLLDEVVARNRDELRQELINFREQVRQGTHAGGGLLGRAAEFLVGQRGL
jgi:hypothetical protein